MLLGQNQLPAEPLSLYRQRADVHTGRDAATSCVMPVPGDVVVPRLLVAVGKGGYNLTRDVVELERDTGLSRQGVLDVGSGSRRVREGLGKGRERRETEPARECRGLQH